MQTQSQVNLLLVFVLGQFFGWQFLVWHALADTVRCKPLKLSCTTVSAYLSYHHHKLITLLIEIMSLAKRKQKAPHTGSADSNPLRLGAYGSAVISTYNFELWLLRSLFNGGYVSITALIATVVHAYCF